MTAAYLLTTLGLVPYFASRALLPLFMTALMLRLGTEWAFVAPLMGVPFVADLPHWATSNVALASLGVGAAIEAVLMREPALREKLSLTDAELKAVLALLLCLVLAPEARGQSAPSGAGLHPTPLHGVAWLGASTGQYVWSALVGACVLVVSRSRNRFYDWIAKLDEDDDLGVQRVLAWLEDALGVLGVVTVFIVPLLAGAAALGALACSLLVARRLRRQRATDQRPCVECGTPIEACAPHCPSCRTAQPSPRAVGLLGTISARAASREHPLQLTRSKRCTYCGTRLRGAGVEVRCQRCGTPAFSSRQAVEAYLQSISRDVPATVLTMAACGAVPVFGLFAGVLYFRLTLLAAIRQYTPISTRVFGRWLLRGVNGILLLLQPVPLLGMVTLPLTALTNTWFYTTRLKRAATQLKPKDYSETLRR